MISRQFAGHDLQGGISRLWFQVRRDRAEVVLVFIWVVTIVFPIVPDRERQTIDEIAELLADGQGSLCFQRHAFGVRRVAPFAADDGHVWTIRGFVAADEL